MGRKIKPQKIFLLDWEGEPIKEFSDLQQVGKELGLRQEAIQQYLKKKSLVRGRYYLSKTREFDPPMKKWTHNPLYSPPSENKLQRFKLEKEEYA
jgi:predicted transcriptional regulator